jgi:hypothetical protein
MAKGGKSNKAKRLEALERSQKITQMLESGTIESEALMGSAGESRPTNESHVLDLLENNRAERTLESMSSSKRSSKKRAVPKKSSKKPSKKSGKAKARKRR